MREGKFLKRFVITSLVVVLAFSESSVVALASSTDNTQKEQEKEVLTVTDISSEETYYLYNLDEEEENIPLYEEQEINEELIITEIPNEAEIEILQEEIDDNSDENAEELILIKYIESEEEETITEHEGYIHIDHIFTSDELNELLENTNTENSTTEDTDNKEEAISETDDNVSEESEEELANDAEDTPQTEKSDEKQVIEEEEEQPEQDTTESEEQEKSENDSAADSEETVSDEEVNDEENTSENEKQEEESATNRSTTARSFSTFSAARTTQTTNYNGIALQNRTHVYEATSTNSNILKSYDQGSILIYRSHNSTWYAATVYLNGKRHAGYIHKNHVENAVANQQSLVGLATQATTRVYKEASTSLGAWKSYPKGSILQYRTFSNNWYQATVYTNGKKRTGYIHKNHVEDAVAKQQSLTGIATQTTTRVYKDASTKLGNWKSYPNGSILKYRTFSKNWYQATVYTSGKKRTGYIRKSDVENAVSKQQSLIGIAKQSTTRVYKNASTKLGSWKSYSAGSILKYQTFSNNWYQATVYTSGKKRTGYIHKNHVENAASKQENKSGFAAKKPTNVYSNASASSSILKTYRIGSELKYKTFSTNWYQATVYIKGEAHTGYIHKKDISADPIRTIIKTNYSYTFSNVVNKQMNVNPKANGSGTIAAERPLVEYYANPSNFPDGTNGFYQFLLLSSPAGLNAKEVNQKVLNNAGTLTGTAQAFIDAANEYDVNEAYLIAHAMHETGNGGSTLAKGVKVNGKTVYNMYGISAYDGQAVIGGAQHAYNQGWFTPEKAIVGGAKFVGKNYVDAGQDTLYKMRWNPAAPATHQYATHVAWAQITTNRIASIYDSLENFVQEFDVPQYNNQPGYQGSEPPPNIAPIQSFPSGIKGVTTGTNVNFRAEPEDGRVITNITNSNSSLTVLGTNGTGWYKAKYNGKTGWISSSYVDVVNMLEITASGLNVRKGAGTNHGSVGQVSNGNLVRAVVNSKNEFVTSNGWYQIYYNGSKRWISSGPSHSYIKIK